MKTTKNNKLIVEFLGKEYVSWTFEYRTQWLSARKTLDTNLYASFNDYADLLYNSSFDWLMPVVKKCFSLLTFSSADECYIYNKIELSLTSCDAKIVYDTVVEFIKWHNENKLEN